MHGNVRVSQTLTAWDQDPSYKKSVLHAMRQQKRSLAPAAGSHEEIVLYRTVGSPLGSSFIIAWICFGLFYQMTEFSAVKYCIIEHWRLQCGTGIVYMDILLGLFKFFAKKSFSVVKEKIATFLQDPPEMVLDRVTELFTEARNQSDRDGTATVTKYFMDRKSKDLLASYICVLFLHLNDFGAVPVAPLVADLGLPAQKVSG